MIRGNPLLQLLHSISSLRVDTLRLPEIISLTEECKANLAAFGSIGVKVLRVVSHVVTTLIHIVLHVLNHAITVHLLIHLVRLNTQRVKQIASL